MKTQPKTKPVFTTEDQEREFWATHSPLDYFDRSTAKKASFNHQGTPIPTVRLWIAAVAVEHGLILLSRDTHFRHLLQIERRKS